MGLVFTFDIVNVKDGPTRYKHAVYYSLAFAEDAALLAIWYIESGGTNVSFSMNFFYFYVFYVASSEIL